MSSGRDDDALSWDGDDDPTLEVGSSPRADPSPTLPAGYTAVGRGAETVGRPGEPAGGSEDGTPRASMGNAALIGIGILGGVYLLLTLGWLVGSGPLQVIGLTFLDPLAFQVAFWLAVAAPAVVFGTVFHLTRRRPAWQRIVLLSAGAVLLIPWPFVLAGAGL